MKDHVTAHGINHFSQWKAILRQLLVLGRRRILYLILIIVFGACKSTVTFTNEKNYETEKVKIVEVLLDGDVKFHGIRPMRRELSRDAIIEASGGFAGLSMVKPKSITLIRDNKKHVIEFEDMRKGKYRRFLVNDGDEIIVNRVFF